MPTPRGSILFRPIPPASRLSWAPGHRPNHRPDSADRRAAGPDLDHALGVAGADLDRIAGPRTTMAAARLLAVDLDGGRGHAAARARPGGVGVDPGGVAGGGGAGAGRGRGWR